MAAQFRLDLRLAWRSSAEEAMEHLLVGDGIAVPRQRLGMRAAGNHLAVDQHAVAVKDDEIEMAFKAHATQVLSSSSGTQYNSSR